MTSLSALDITYIVAATMSALVLGLTARYKLTRDEQVMATLARVGVPDRMVPVLASLQLLAATGLVVGIILRPVGLAAAIGMAMFFIGAALAHLRVGDRRGTAVPIALGAVALAPLATSALTL